MAKKISYQDLIFQFDEYERIFAKNIYDVFLTEFIEDLEKKISISEFNHTQIEEITIRLRGLIQLFSEKKEKIQLQSNETIKRRNCLHQYINNSLIKKY